MTYYIEGKEVYNASHPMVIYITAEDVSFARTKEPDACAAAVACMRNPGVQAARVHISTTYLKVRGKWFRYGTPLNLRDEIISFDRGGQFYPGEFRLKAITPSMARNRRSGSRTSVTSASKRVTHMVEGVREHATKGLEKKLVQKKGKRK